jgi:hypothetical protein
MLDPLPFAAGHDQISLGFGHLYAREHHQRLTLLNDVAENYVSLDYLCLDSRRDFDRAVDVQSDLARCGDLFGHRTFLYLGDNYIGFFLFRHR